MAQHDYSIANQGFPATRADINNVLSAIATNNSGTSAPSTQYAGQFWIDTTSSTWTLYIHDGADDIQFATIDTSANTVNFIDSELGDNSVTTAKIADGNVTSAKLSYPLTTFSSTGIDDNATSTAITIDSSQRVGIGITSPLDQLSVLSSGIGRVRFAPASGSVSNLLLSGLTTGDSGFQFNSNQLNMFSYGDIAFFPSTSNISGSYPNGEVMRIRNNGNVGIGTSSPDEKLTLSADGSTASQPVAISLNANRASGSGGATSIIESETDGASSESRLKFYTRPGSGSNPTERMRINSSGDVFIGKTSAQRANTGIELHNAGDLLVTRGDGGPPVSVNRENSDGGLIDFFGDNIFEGSIEISGSTVSYNGFTGTHWSRFTDNSKPNILKGTVLESLDEMCDWYNLHFDITTTTQDEDGNDVTNTVTEKVPHVLADGQSFGDVITYNHEGTDYQATIVKEGDIKHMKSKVSDTVDAKNVYGVFKNYDEDGEGYNDFYVASVGSFVVRIKANETIAKGDLLQSNGDGTAKVQTDDNVKSSSFAKVLSTTVIETYDDGSFIVPCSLMC